MARPEIIKTPLGQRLRDVRRALDDMDRSELAQKLGFKLNTLANYERGDTQPDSTALTAYRTVSGVNIDWLITGEGEMFRPQELHPLWGGKTSTEKAARDKAIQASIRTRYRPTILPRPDLIPIRRLPTSASAGSGAINESEDSTDYFSFSRKWIEERNFDSDSLSVITVSGDSMEPKLCNNDLILVDRDQTTVRDGKSYVVRMGDELVVKNVQHLGDDKISLLSINTFYPPRTIDLPKEGDAIQIVGRVVASMHEW